MDKKKLSREEQIAKMMEALSLSYEEAAELVGFDNGEIENEEVEKIEKKIAENTKSEKSKQKRSTLEKVKNMKKKKAVDADKEKIMAVIKEMVAANLEIFGNAQSLTPTKITFTLNGNYYTISLTKHKSKPDGYNEENKMGE